MICMNKIRCPMCGLDSAISTFDPEELDRDIYVRNAVGLGRGGGFHHGPDESILGDDSITPKIVNRCVDLLNLFIENNIVSSQELAVKLKMGVPVQGTDEVVPYEDVLKVYYRQNEALIKRTSSLEKQVSIARNGVSRLEYERLKTGYEKLINRARVKRKIDEILKHLHVNLDSKIILGEDDWMLEIYECTPEIYIYLNKKLYGLNRKERNMLESRIKTKCDDIEILFWIFKSKPTITSVTDILNKNPGRYFYELHNLPIPDYCKDHGENSG